MILRSAAAVAFVIVSVMKTLLRRVGRQRQGGDIWWRIGHYGPERVHVSWYLSTGREGVEKRKWQGKDEEEGALMKKPLVTASNSSALPC
jgi:hypothetical protein